jgi:hypothetical protein
MRLMRQIQVCHALNCLLFSLLLFAPLLFCCSVIVLLLHYSSCPKEKCTGGAEIWTTNFPVELGNLEEALDRSANCEPPLSFIALLKNLQHFTSTFPVIFNLREIVLSYSFETCLKEVLFFWHNCQSKEPLTRTAQLQINNCLVIFNSLFYSFDK